MIDPTDTVKMILDDMSVYYMDIMSSNSATNTLYLPIYGKYVLIYHNNSDDTLSGIQFQNGMLLDSKYIMEYSEFVEHIERL